MSKRKYKAGEMITTMDEVLKQEFIYWYHKIYHMGWFRSWQVQFLENQIKLGRIRYAIKIEKEEKSC